MSGYPLCASHWRGGDDAFGWRAFDSKCGMQGEDFRSALNDGAPGVVWFLVPGDWKDSEAISPF